jgi:hypothetical protein
MKEGLISFGVKGGEIKSARKARKAEIAENKAKLGIGAPENLPTDDLDFLSVSDTVTISNLTNSPKPLKTTLAELMEREAKGLLATDPDKISWTPNVVNKKGEEVVGKPRPVSLSGDSRVESTREKKKKAKRKARTASQELKSYKRKITLAERMDSIGGAIDRGMSRTWNFVKKGSMVVGALGGLAYGVKAYNEKGISADDLKGIGDGIVEMVKPIPEKIENSVKNVIGNLGDSIKKVLLRNGEVVKKNVVVTKEDVEISEDDVNNIKSLFNNIIIANNESVISGGPSYFSNPDFLQKYNEIAEIYRNIGFYIVIKDQKNLRLLLEKMENKVEELQLLIPQN